MLKKSALLIRLIVILGLLLTTFPTSPVRSPKRTALAAVAPAEPPPPESELPTTAPQATPAAPPAPTSAPHTIHLQSREFIPDEPDLPALRRLTTADGGRVHVLLQLDFIPREAAKAALAARGIELLAYVPDYAWIASVPATNPAAALQHPGVTWAGELAANDKLAPAIVDAAWGSYNLAADGTAAVYVALHKDVSLDDGRKAIISYGGRITGQVTGINLLVAEMPRDNIRALAAADIVQWIEPAAPPLTGANDGSRQQIGVDVLQAAPYNLDGTGLDVLVYDSGQVGAHVDFGTRLTHGDTDTVSGHSTHVAGTLGGDGSNSTTHSGTALQWRGMAPNVDLISYGTGYSGSGVIFYENVPDIEHDWAEAQNTYGADFGTASLGSNIYANYAPTHCHLMGNYGAASVLIDQIVRGGNSTVGIGDKYIATWAAGNERGWTSSCTTGYGLVAPPAGAKNPIHVGGANTNNNTQYAHTSWGPTDDGRLKPIVTAGACQTSGDYGIKSTDDFPADAYTVKCGTSMATPAVAGGIALMLQHYRDVYNTTGVFWPSAAKAILIQTATDLGRPGPDYQWGYGLVDIHAAVDLISRKAFRQTNIAQGEVDVYYFIVPNDTTPATVSLAWDDYEATFNANPTLINDLDLELVAPDGTIWHPWVLDPANPTHNATRDTNSVDNQEQVRVPTPQIGTWLVRVKGTTVPQGPQDYSLVCEGCKPLNVGVCQEKIDGSTPMALSGSEDMTGALDPAALEGVGEEDVRAALTPEQPTAGEIWQRALEAASEDGVATTMRQATTRRALAALEAARAVGPEAVVALLDTLDAPALDLIIDEIAAAQERLAFTPPPAPATGPDSPDDEETARQAQETNEAANRALALARTGDPQENQSQKPMETGRLRPAAPSAPAADLTVGNGCTYATVQDAIDAANPGDRLLLEGGHIFTENLTIPISLTLQGGYSGCASGSTSRTTVDGNAVAPVVETAAALDITLLNLNITNGNTTAEGGGVHFAPGSGAGASTLTLNSVHIYSNTAQWGGGLWVGPNTEVIGTNIHIYSNTASSVGGGVRLYAGRATFADSSIHDNSAPLGGGVAGLKSDGFAPELTLSSSTDIYNNTALTGDGQGGGVYFTEGTLSLAGDSDLIVNNAIQGGGAYLISSTLTIGGNASWIYNNMATGHGGGIYAQGSAVNLDDDAQLYSNTAGTDGNGAGGGAYLDNSTLYGDKITIRNNTANNYGGGIYATNGSTIDMDLGPYLCLSAPCSRLYGNVANNSNGGGIYAYNSSIYLDNTFIQQNNAAGFGGGVYAYHADVYVNSSLFSANNATGSAGDAVRLFAGSTLNGSGNTWAYNDSGGADTGRAIDTSTSNVTLACSIIWGHASSLDTTGHTVTYSDIQGGYAGTGNLATDPFFVSSSDFHLQSTSPAIDRCLSGPSTDFEGETRPIVLGTAASPYDMGADEASGVARVGVNGACAYSTIQQAVNAAEDGDTVRIAEGVYFENVDIPGKNITLGGGYDSTCTTHNITGTTRIEGSTKAGSTLDVANSTLEVRDLDIAWGSAGGAGVDAVGNSHVTLDNVDVLNNHASYGGGVYVGTNSAVTLTNGARLFNNTATDYGGGARVWGQFGAYGSTSNILSNCAPGGGGLYVPGGQVVLDQADVRSNQAAAADGKGGGIYVTGNGTVQISDAEIGTLLFLPTQEAYDGAGIYADNSTVTLDGVKFGYNIAAHDGGGLYLGNNSTLHAANTDLGHTIRFIVIVQYGNSAAYGGGLYATASTVNFNGTIATNGADYSGGGVYATGSAITLTGTTVGLAGAALGNYLRADGHTGAGLYLTGGSSGTLSDTVLVSNTFQTTGHTYGGGAYIASNSTLMLQDSRIERHDAPSSGDGRGAGLYINDSTVTLNNSQVLSNTAGTVGGGVRVWDSALNILNDSVIRGNRSLTGEGGGIAATGTSGITVTDATLEQNHAGTDGGALYLDTGTLDFTGVWTLSGNEANGNGGAIAANAATVTLGATPTSATHAAAATAPCGSLSGACRAFYNNIADKDDDGAGYGGSIYVNDSTLHVAYTYFHRNIAARGGAIYQGGSGAVAEVDNTLIHTNTATAGYGAGIRSEGGVFTVTHVTLANNQNGAGYSQSDTAGYAVNSIAWGNTSGGFWITSGTVTGTCSLDQTGNAGPALNPQFVSPGAGEDYHLLGNSPAIDACPTGLTPDLDNVPRPVNGGYDMGAYEYPHSLAFTPDRTGDGYAGHSTRYTHTLTNTGAVTDTFTLTGLSTHGWTLTLPAPVTLAAGQSTPIEVTVHVPSGTALGIVDTAVITATLSGDPALAARVVDTTTVACWSVSGANFTFTPDPAEVDQLVVFTGTIAAGELPITYLWNFGDSSAETSGNPITHTFTTSNTFTVWMTATNACPSTATVTRQVTVVTTEMYIFLPLVMRNH